MNNIQPEMNYDAHDAAYLFSNMLNLYRQAPEEVTGEHTSDMDVMGLMWASAADAAAALNVEVDFSAGWDGVFAYEELDHDADGSLAHSIFENCIASSAMTVEDVVRAHAVKEGWPLNRPEAAPDAVPQIGTPEAAPEAVPAQPAC